MCSSPEDKVGLEFWTEEGLSFVVEDRACRTGAVPLYNGGTSLEHLGDVLWK